MALKSEQEFERFKREYKAKWNTENRKAGRYGYHHFQAADALKNAIVERHKETMAALPKLGGAIKAIAKEEYGKWERTAKETYGMAKRAARKGKVVLKNTYEEIMKGGAERNRAE